MINRMHGISVVDRTVLNQVQRDAVLYDSGPQLVFAGAGTGKTRVLTTKIAYLIEKGYFPSRIFAATFTNKAAKEMRNRVEELTGMSVSDLWIGTFHSLCARILRMDAIKLGYGSHFTIYDSSDQVSLVKKILKEFDIDDRTMPPKAILSVISHQKSRCITPEALSQTATGFYDQEIVKIYKAYQKKLKEQQAMDFDDLIANTVYLFKNNPDILQKYQNRFHYILVDEYQDTNSAQFLLLKYLSHYHKKVFAVGDDDQSIYGWRGAQVENILSFEREFPQTRVFKLEQNYRSTRPILDFANAAISENVNRAAKQLWTDRSSGSAVNVIRYRDDRQESETVSDKIQELTAKGVKGGDIAILFRTNAQSRPFEDSLRKRKIPYVLVGGTGFYERAEIKDCLAYLRLLVNPKDNVSFERIMNVPARGLGDKARETIAEVASGKNCSMLEAILGGDPGLGGSRYAKSLSELRDMFALLLQLKEGREAPHVILKEMLQLSGYMDMLTEDDSEESQGRIENLNELVNALRLWIDEKPEGTLELFLEEVALVSDVDSWDKKEDAVNLMTLHCAKGLEFRSVFLVGVEDGILPSRQNLDDMGKLEEERRLLYVGTTRAMEYLECSHADQRWRFGDLIPSMPSRFLASIPANLYSVHDLSGFFGAVKTLRNPPGAQGTSPSRGPLQQRVASSRPVQSTRTPQPSAAPKVPAYDEFSQETVEYRMGQHVSHKVYGRGRIVSISGFGTDMKLTVLFNDGTRKKLMARFANFEKV